MDSSNDVQRIKYMCGSVVMAAPQDIADETAVVTAAGGATDDFSGAAGGAVGELQWSCSWGAAAEVDAMALQVVAAAKMMQWRCRWWQQQRRVTVHGAAAGELRQR